MRRLPALLAALAVALGGCSALNLGGPLGAPVADGPTPPLAQDWDQAVGAGFGPAAPYVTDRFVTVGTRRGEVVVLDRETGRQLGAVSLGNSVEGQIAVSAGGEILYVPTAEDKGSVTAYSVATGTERWRWRGGPVQGGVVLAGDRVVVSALDGTTVGLDAETGEVAWTRASPAGVQIHAAPALAGLDVIVADDKGAVVRLDRQSGAVRWTADVGQPVYATPTADGADVFVSTTRGRVARLNAATGATTWSVDAAATLRATSAAVSGDAVIVGFSDGTVRALNRATGAERWRHTSDGTVTAQPAVFGDHVAIGTMDRQLVVVEAATGRAVWSAELRGRTKSALGVGGGRLYVLVEPGRVVAFRSAPDVASLAPTAQPVVPQRPAP